MSTPDLTLDTKFPIPTNEKAPPPPSRLVRALQAFEEAAGGRETMVAELATSTLSDKASLLVRLMADPDRDRQPLHELLAYSGLSVSDFLRLLKDAKGARAYLAALHKVWEKLPDVAADVMSRALPSEVRCKPCQGTGFQRVATTKGKNLKGKLRNQMNRMHCPSCEGSGKISVEPTLDYQKLALSLGGLPKPIPGTQIDNSKTLVQASQQNFYGSDTMRDFVSAVTRVKYGPAPSIPVEAEPVPEEEP